MVQFKQILRRLKDHDVDFVVIGGIAATLLGSPMATYDVDVCVPLDEASLVKILNALREVRPRLRMRPDKMPLPDNPQRLKGVKNLYLLTDLGEIDLLGEVPGIGTYPSLFDKTVETDVGGFTCRVLNIETLIESKKVAGRDKDRVAIYHLEAIRSKQGDGGAQP